MMKWDNMKGEIINKEEGGYIESWEGRKYMKYNKGGGIIIEKRRERWKEIRKEIWEE